MNPMADRATFSSRSSIGFELAGDAAAAVEGGLVLEDLGVMLEHQLVEDDELPDPQHAEGADVGPDDDQRPHRVVEVPDAGLYLAHGNGRDHQAEEGQPPEGDDFLEQVRAPPLAPGPGPVQVVGRNGADADR